MKSRFLTNYTETTFLSTIQMNLRRCKAFNFSVSFIKKASLVLLSKDIKAAVERGAKGRIFQCVRKIKCQDLLCRFRFDEEGTKYKYCIIEFKVSCS